MQDIVDVKNESKEFREANKRNQTLTTSETQSSRNRLKFDYHNTFFTLLKPENREGTKTEKN